jgi:hypothetical protein
MVNEKIVNDIMEKKIYTTPKVELILIDHEIALALESAPPAGPSEVFNSVQNPFKQESGLV